MTATDSNAGESEIESEQVEWMVEYILEIRGEQPVRSVTILHGSDLDDVRSALHRELTGIHPDVMRIDVTVIRMALVEMQTNQTLFDEEEGIYQP
jgi:hypothetical protein